MVLAWVPLSMHCKLESVPSFAFLSCETEAQHEQEPKSDCNDDGCCDFEFALYKSDQLTVTCPPAAQMQLLAILLEDMPLLELAQTEGAQTTAPPELPRSWHFISRAALQPRAPSIAS